MNEPMNEPHWRTLTTHLCERAEVTQAYEPREHKRKDPGLRQRAAAPNKQVISTAIKIIFTSF